MSGYTGGRYESVGVVHHWEAIGPDSNGRLSHWYWEDDAQKVIPHYYSREEFEAMIADDA